MNSKDTKTSGQLKKEVTEKLIEVEQGIGKIQRRMTPGQVIDDIIYYPHGGNQQAIFEHLKHNPIGASFLTIGTLLLMEDEKHQSYEEIIKTQASSSLESVKEKYQSAKESTKQSLKTKEESIGNLPPLSFVALGIGLGSLSGASLPISDKEKTMINDKFGVQLQEILNELKVAANESADVFKSEFLSQVKDVDVSFFKTGTPS